MRDAVDRSVPVPVAVAVAVLLAVAVARLAPVRERSGRGALLDVRDRPDLTTRRLGAPGPWCLRERAPGPRRPCGRAPGP
ncbi:hypothetical protein [Streptomyces cinereoruber]|uniref:hypothetical protein n=1 Tax=Streptomyces cinereoruber TaxID=67260 RepID=UPI0036254AE2